MTNAVVGARPVLFVTGHAPRDRIGAFVCLHERENVEFALFGGRSKHGGAPSADPLPFPHHRVSQAQLLALILRGSYRAVVCSTGGRVALPATWAAARAARIPLILWTSLWAHPRSPAHAFSYLALARLYRTADAVVTYGPHVSDYARARGARNVYVARQAVDNEFWADSRVAQPSGASWPEGTGMRFLFVGRPAREKGLAVLIQAWRTSGLRASTAALVLVGVGSDPPRVPVGGAAGSGEPQIVCREALDPTELRNFYAAADVLVLPSIATPTFREPWGLVVNEAMNQRLPIIASDAVGAVAGGLVRHGRNGLVFASGDSPALGRALVTLAHDPGLGRRMGAAGAVDVSAYTFQEWSSGFSQALAGMGLSRERW